MARVLISFSLAGQDVDTTATEILVERTKGVYEAYFDPDEIWSYYDGHMTAVFRPAFGQPEEVPIVDFQCAIPQAVLFSPWLQVGVYARIGNLIYPTKFSGRVAVRSGALSVKSQGGS